MKTISHYQILITGDGSPTAILGQNGEKMHHPRGAFSETLYIYGDALERALSFESLNLMSVGLGLGYVEMMVAGRLVKNILDTTSDFEAGLHKFISFKNLKIVSYEADPFLTYQLLSWLELTSEPLEDGDPFCRCYEIICQKMAEHFQIEKNQIKKFLVFLYEKNRWQLCAALQKNTKFYLHPTCVFYDAFSASTSSELWSEEFLQAFFVNCASPCVFATYAALGRLNRLLAEHQFIKIAKARFGGRRNSTLAIRVSDKKL